MVKINKYFTFYNVILFMTLCVMIYVEAGNPSVYDPKFLITEHFKK